MIPKHGIASVKLKRPLARMYLYFIVNQRGELAGRIILNKICFLSNGIYLNFSAKLYGSESSDKRC